MADLSSVWSADKYSDLSICLVKTTNCAISMGRFGWYDTDLIIPLPPAARVLMKTKVSAYH